MQKKNPECSERVTHMYKRSSVTADFSPEITEVRRHIKSPKRKKINKEFIFGKTVHKKWRKN